MNGHRFWNMIWRLAIAQDIHLSIQPLADPYCTQGQILLASWLYWVSSHCGKEPEELAGENPHG